jgi:hypothetical protein
MSVPKSAVLGKQDRECIYKVTSWRVRLTFIPLMCKVPDIFVAILTKFEILRHANEDVNFAYIVIALVHVRHIDRRADVKLRDAPFAFMRTGLKTKIVVGA